MPAQTISLTPKITLTTPGTTLDSGLNMAGSSAPPARSNGDPYRPVCEELHALLSRKRGYYGCRAEHPLENARGVADQGIEPWVYQLARIGEKVRRAGGLKETLDLQKIRETLMDIAGHAAVAIALLDNPED
jgi:hypothetical protein